MQRANANPFPIFPVNANARSAAPTCSNGNAITEEKTVGKPSTNSTRAIKAAKTAPIRIINDFLFMTSPQLLFYDNIIARELSFVNNSGNIFLSKNGRCFTRKTAAGILLPAAVLHLSIFKGLIHCHSFQILHRIAVEYQFGICHRVIVDQIVQL